MMLDRVASSGPFKGHNIRIARKPGKCAENFAHRINVGDSYVEGDVDPYSAGGFGKDRVCLECAMLAERAKGGAE